MSQNQETVCTIGKPLTLAETKKLIIDPFLHIEEADQVLFEFDFVCKIHKIDYVLACGTCLGFYRDGGYIKGDNDIDICVNIKDIDRLTKVIVDVGGFRLGRRGGSQHYIKNHVLIDVWFKPEFDPPYAVVKYKNGLYPIPKEPERYLAALYDDWKTPSKQSAKEAVHRNYK